jgi:capsular polysaccharide biosynthesis protein
LLEEARHNDTIEALVERGVAARHTGDHVGALALFEEAIELDPARAGTPHGQVVFTLLGLGLTTLATEALERALALGADVPRADLQRGRLAAVQGDAELALRCFTKTIADFPRSPWPYVLAAEQLRTLERYRDALEIVAEGLKQCGGPEAGSSGLVEERAFNLAALGLIEEAREDIRPLLALRRNATHLRSVAFFLASRNQFSAALELLESLESDAQEHLVDILYYRRTVTHIRSAQTRFEKMSAQANRDRSIEQLDVRPYVFSREVMLDEVRSLAAVDHPTKCYLIDDPASPAPEPPHDLDRLLEEDLALMRRKLSHGVRRVCFQYLLPDCFIEETHRVVLRSGRFVSELCYGVNAHMVSGSALWEPAAAGPIDQAFVTPYFGWTNYFHAVVDVLSTLAIYKRLGLSCPIVVPGEIEAIHAEIIRASGIPEDTPVLTASDVRGRHLGLAVCPGHVSAQLLRAWSATVVRRTVGDSEDEVGDEIVYISRAKSPHRPLANEEQLEEMLRSGWGCRVVHTEDLSLAEQVKLVLRARIVMGPHGAGLTNTLFAPRGAPLIELLPSRYLDLTYANLARTSGRLYLPIVGSAEDTSVTHERDLHWRVDMEKVSRVLESALGVSA